MNVPLDEVLQVIRNLLSKNQTLPLYSVLKVEDIMELFEVCMKATYFQIDKFFQRKEGMAM
jgi:hypothetical protein